MKIGIDGRTLTNRRGIGNVVFHLIHGLSDIPFDGHYVVYIDDQEAIKFVPKDSRFVVRLIGPKFYPLWEQVILPYYAAKDNLDILHCTGNSAPIFLPKKIKLVLSIMDVMFMFPKEKLPKSPSVYQRIGRKYLKYIVPIVARCATAITTISSTSCNDILQYLKKVNREKITVISLAANEYCKKIPSAYQLKETQNKFGLDSQFVLALGAIDPRKNTALVLEAFAKFHKDNLHNIKLVIVGLPPVGLEKFQKIAKNLGVENKVICIGFVDEQDLVSLYNLATIFLYPSLYEGFGLPVLEAMTCGTPVITSNSGSIPEIAGDAAILIDPKIIEEMVDAMQLLLFGDQFRNDLVIKGRLRSDMFSWQKAAQQTFSLYQSI